MAEIRIQAPESFKEVLLQLTGIWDFGSLSALCRTLLTEAIESRKTIARRARARKRPPMPGATVRRTRAHRLEVPEDYEVKAYSEMVEAFPGELGEIRVPNVPDNQKLYMKKRAINAKLTFQQYTALLVFEAWANRTRRERSRPELPGGQQSLPLEEAEMRA
jgi:hypothetical protein